MVVELDVVEVDGAAHCSMDGHVGIVDVVLFFEIRSLRGMGDDVVREQLSELGLEGDHPLFACAYVHGVVVFPVNVHPVQVVCVHIVGKVDGTLSRVLVGAGRVLGSPECTDKDLDASIVVLLLQGLLDLVGVAS